MSFIKGRTHSTSLSTPTHCHQLNVVRWTAPWSLAERGPMLCMAETSPSHYLPHLNTNISQLQIDHLLKMSLLVYDTNNCLRQSILKPGITSSKHTSGASGQHGQLCIILYKRMAFSKTLSKPYLDL